MGGAGAPHRGVRDYEQYLKIVSMSLIDKDDLNSKKNKKPKLNGNKKCKKV